MVFVGSTREGVGIEPEPNLSLFQSYGQNNSFDIFIFTQHWPITTCIDWESKDKKNGCTAIGMVGFGHEVGFGHNWVRVILGPSPPA